MGLVSYASSDEESDKEKVQVKNEKNEEVKVKATTELPVEAEKQDSKEEITSNKKNESKPEEESIVVIGPITQSAVPLGPSLPPMDAPITTTTIAEDEAGPSQEPQSPYSATRALVHDLTLPSVPNLDIPPSPPGSPPPGANKKFEQFLNLKRKGTHFNAKLEQSMALRNPSLMDKLLAFVNIDEAGQYETTLPAELWDPKGFPDWAFRDRLKKSRERIFKERESEKASGSRSSIDFVASTNPSSGNSAASTGGLASRGEKRKGGWK